MDGDFASKLKTVLSDPEAMAKISAIASGLGATPREQDITDNIPKTETTLNISPDIAKNNFLSQNDPHLALLSTLKPLVREEKRDKIDSLIKALAVASMMKNFRK